MIVSINPATGNELARFEAHSPAEVDAALTGAVRAQATWRRKPVTERVALLRGIARVLRENKAEYAAMITREMGKPLPESEGEIEKCAWNCDFYAEAAPGFLADQVIASSASESGVVFDPLGVVLAIMPWNYPFWQFFRFAAPAFAAGNGAILKHANNVPQCAVAIEAVVRKAGAPDGLFRTLLIEAREVAGLIADDRIAAVTLTGSTEVGSIVAAQAGQALKKQVLELGGSVVLRPSDIPARQRGGGAKTIPLVTRHIGSTSFINGITIFAPGATIPMHFHNCEESVLMLEGNAVAEIDGAELPVGAGDVTFIPAGVPHRFRNTSATAGMRILWTYASIDAPRTLVETGDTRSIDEEHKAPVAD